jgi:hypothetical protein
MNNEYYNMRYIHAAISCFTSLAEPLVVSQAAKYGVHFKHVGLVFILFQKVKVKTKFYFISPSHRY